MSATKSSTESCSGRWEEDVLRENIGLAASDGKGLQGIAHHLAALPEGRFHNGLEEGFVAAQFRAGVAREANDGAFHLGRRGKTARPHGKEVLDVVPGLQKDAQDAVGLAAGFFGYSLGHFLLHHAHYLGDVVLVVQHLEEDLGRDIVGEIADDGELFREKLFQLKFEEVPFHEASLHTLEVGEKVLHTLRVDLDKPEVNVFPLQQVLGKNAHAGTHFQGGKAAVKGVNNGAGHLLVREEMLPEGFLCAYFCHTCKGKGKIRKNLARNCYLCRLESKCKPTYVQNTHLRRTPH